ncbi:MAG TPA: TonB-dependent receptor, partial [Vicinamibacterales bacterium]|nr:TonB-dependent receptor [Vicinamibacterales bacterium]
MQRPSHGFIPGFIGLALAAVLVGAGALPAAAQTAAGGDFEGTVRDATGAVLPGATLVLTNVDTGVERASVTNEIGRYRIPAVPAGAYTLRVSLDGFATMQREGLALEVGQVLRVDITLPPAGVSQEVTVTAAAPIVEQGRTQTGAVVSRTEIENLPSNGRDFLSFSTQIAGVTGQQMSGQGSGISFNGQRARSNNVSLDGVDANGALNGNTRQTISQEAVREYQVVTSQFAPEFGRASGGLVNIVSRSGTNDLRGNAFLYVRDESLDARNAFVTAGRPEFQRQNFGGTLGGPLKRGRTFFFGAFERMRRDESGVISITDANVAAINAVLAARPIPGSAVTSITNGVYPITRRDSLASLKIDHTLSPKHLLAFRYTYGKSTEANAGGVGIGGLITESGGGGQRGTDQSVLLSWTNVMSSSLLGEARLQVAPRDLEQYANDPVGPRVSISGVATWGRNTNFPVILDEVTTQGSYTLSWQRGAHFLKAGADVAHIAARSSFPVSFAGSFSFGSLASFAAGTPSTFTQGFGNPQIDLPDTLYAAFVQDSWTVNDRLTFVYGLRYDYDAQPQRVPRDRSNPLEAPLDDGIHRDPNNVSPRAGFTWDPIGGGRTIIRGGYGRFYDKVFLLVARNALLARQSVSLSGANAALQFARGAFPESDQLPAGFTLTRPSINKADPEMQIPYLDQVSLGVERQIGTHWSVAINGVRNWGSALLVSNNINLGPPTILTSANAASLGVSNPSPQQIGRPYYGSTNRLDPLYNNIQMVSSSGWSSYYGVQFTVQKRLANGYSLRANYILSESK